MEYSKESFQAEMKKGIISRFEALSKTEQDIMREHMDSEFSRIAMKVLGNDLLSELPRIRRPNE